MLKEWNISTYKRFVKEGRGQGDGATYQPWIKIQDISSKGRSTRIYSYTTERVMHLLSDLQLSYFYLLEYDSFVVDIKEQYPLLDLMDSDISLDHSMEKRIFQTKGDVPRTLTTPFLITRQAQDGSYYNEARVIKLSSELNQKAVIERLEIQRRYYEMKGIDFGIVTEHEIPKNIAKRIAEFLPYYSLDGFDELVTHYGMIRSDVLSIISNQDVPFRQLFQHIEKTYQLMRGNGLVFYKHLLASKQITMNLMKEMDWNQYLSTYDVNLVGGEMKHNEHSG